MPKHRRSYSAKRSRRTSRQIHDSTIGTHVARPGRQAQTDRSRAYAEALARRARIRRIFVGILVVVVVLAIAIGAGVLAFRGTVGGALSLKDSDASGSLVAVKSGEPSYALVTAELGAVATPLDNGGPDVILLARLDPENGSLALVNIPSGLQITTDNRSDSVDSIAASGDAALIDAISTFAKIDVSHFVKLAGEDDLAGLIDVLGGIEVDVRQKVDDPHAGHVSIPKGTQVLDGQTALVYLRADNLEYGAEDRLENQLGFASALVSKLFSSAGNFTTRLDSVVPYIQTDYSLDDLEAIDSWLGGVDAGAIETAVLPGYFMAVTDVSGSDKGRYVSTSSEVAELIGELESGQEIVSDDGGATGSVSKSGFTVEIQNGTTVTGAAAAAADVLKAAGFTVGDVGNAEQPVYEETIVVYKGSDSAGETRARAVIDAYGAGRAVDGDAYYSFDSDVLLIVGADSKPTA